jgi:N-acetylmuramoyl-L-alanine amidase
MEIILIAGHGGSDKGAKGVVYNGHQLYESEMTIVIRDLMYHYMMMSKSEYPNLKVIKDDDSFTLNGIISWLGNIYKGRQDRLIFDIHFDAFNGKVSGTSTFIPDDFIEHEKKLGEKIAGTTAAILKVPNRGCRLEKQSARKRLGIMRPIGINVLWEVAFIDNLTDVDAVYKNIGSLCSQNAKNILEYMKKIS